MAAVTRGNKAPKPTAKAASRPKTSNKSKTSSRPRSNKGTKTTPKATTNGDPTPTNDHGTVQVPEIPSSGTVTPDLIEETDIETSNGHDVLRALIRNELSKARKAQPAGGQTKTHRVHKSHSRRHHRHSRHYLSDSSTDSKAGNRPIVSFLH